MQQIPLTINQSSFRWLVGNITLYAVSKINEQWEKLSLDRLPPCTGSYRKRLLLPYVHNLEHAYNLGILIPKSIVHPRYWLQGPICMDSDWRPTYDAYDRLIDSVQKREIGTV